MKVLMTADTVGGVWSYALELSRAMASFNVSVALATMGAPLSRDQRQEVSRIPNIDIYESDYKLIWMQDPWNDVEEAGQWLLEIAAHVQPDVVHLNDYPHGAIGWNAPVLMVGHSCVLSWWNAVRRQPAPRQWNRYRQAVARGLRAADLVVAPTRAMLSWLERFYGPFSASKVILNGRDPGDYRPGAKQPMVLAAGRVWDEAKNLAALARVAPRLGWPVYVAGDACHPDGREISLPSVRFLGRIPSAELAEWYRPAAVYALPARYEPFGLTALEAALSGCALVLGDIDTLRELWDGAACFVPPDDEEALAAAINHLIDDPEERMEHVERAQRRSRQYSARRMAAGYVAAYRDLITRQHKHSGAANRVGAFDLQEN